MKIRFRTEDGWETVEAKDAIVEDSQGTDVMAICEQFGNVVFGVAGEKNFDEMKRLVQEESGTRIPVPPQ